MDPEYKDVRVKRSHDDGQGHEILHTVDTQQGRQSLIQQPQGPDHERQQRMAVDIVDRIPVSDTQIGQGVVAREVQLAFEHLPIGSETLLHEQVVHTPDEQTVQHNNHQQHHTSLYALLRLQFED